MWDERYSADDYVYGTEPNDFLVERFGTIPKGKVLSLAEGEGRNAVFLAKQGYEVTAVDGSSVGLEKARRLAEAHGVELQLVHADLEDFDPGENKWDGIISIFVPLPSPIRKALYNKLEQALKPGGVFLLEAYRPDQIGFGTGGGSSTDTMQTKDSLLAELPNFDFMHLLELERNIIEGRLHTGTGAVVQAIAVKR